jgi:hypothetical protein
MKGIPFLFLLVFSQAYAQTDPLPSWNDGAAKKTITDFVKMTTEKGSAKFVASEARIAVFDQDAYWGLGIGAAIMGRAPLIGPNLVHLLLGGPIIAGETLSRFFTLHVVVIPGLLIGLITKVQYTKVTA